MALSTLVYISLLAIFALGGAFYHPLISLLSYFASYHIPPSAQWWGYAPLASWGVRHCFVLATATAIGVFLNRSKLNYGRLLESQEKLMILFLALIWLSIPFGVDLHSEKYNALKMTKVILIVLIASHIVTDIRRYELLLWTIILVASLQAYQLHKAPDWVFHGGRFDRGVGASDLFEGNFLAAHFAMILPFLAVMFIRDSWKVKLLCLPCGALIVNGFILCRSRGGFVAVLFGIGASVLFARHSRWKILVCLGLAAIGLLVLSDPGFWDRSMKMSFDSAKLDDSAHSRIQAWKAALQIVYDHPYGSGEGNFKRIVGLYNPELAGIDAHNTLLRCMAELGIQGAVVLFLLMGNAFRMTIWIRKRAGDLKNGQDYLWHVWALQTALVIYIVAGNFVTHTYIEEFYWLLIFPVMIKRAAENEIASSTNT